MTAAVIYARSSHHSTWRARVRPPIAWGGRAWPSCRGNRDRRHAKKAMCGWTPLTASEREYPHVTLFRDRDYGAVPYRRMRRALHEALTRRSRRMSWSCPAGASGKGIAGLSWCLSEAVCRESSCPPTHAADTRQRLVKLWLKRRIVSCYQAGFVAGSRQLRYLAGLGLAAGACFVGCAVVDNGQFAAHAAPGEKITGASAARVRAAELRARLHPRKNTRRAGDAGGAAGRLDVDHRGRWSAAGRDRATDPRAFDREVTRFACWATSAIPRSPRCITRADAYLQPSVSSEPTRGAGRPL